MVHIVKDSERITQLIAYHTIGHIEISSIVLQSQSIHRDYEALSLAWALYLTSTRHIVVDLLTRAIKLS